MRRRDLLALIGAGLVMAGTAQAQSFSDRVVAALRARGYQQIEVSRTLLGRTRILARKGPEIREIILNPRTGETLRDFWQITTEDGDDRSGPGLLDPDDDDDDDDDDGSDDDGSDDHGGGDDSSGPGGGGDDD